MATRNPEQELQLVAEAIITAREIQEFIWGRESRLLGAFDADGWRELFQKRVDRIAAVDITKFGGRAELRKRLLQQAALSIKALVVVDNMDQQ